MKELPLTSLVLRTVLFLTSIFLTLTSNQLQAADFEVNYSSLPATTAITVNPGTYTFQVNNVPSGFSCVWYVNGAAKETDNVTWTDDDLTYEKTFIICASDTKIEGRIFNAKDGGGTNVATATWNAKITHPDLVVSGNLNETTVNPGSNLTINWTITNIGGLRADFPTTQLNGLYFYLSDNNTIDASDVVFTQNINDFEPNESRAGSKTITIPSNKECGVYYIIRYVDAENNIEECDGEGNNNRSFSQIPVGAFSYSPTGISGGGTICSGQSASLCVAGGSLASGASWRWYTGSCGGNYIGSGSCITVTPSATTTYYVRAEGGTCNVTTSCTSTTVTVCLAPSVTTSTPVATSPTTATYGGNVTSDGGCSVTARGVCWSTSPNPTTSNSKTTNGTGTGSFSGSITGLTANTTYHIRAYATNCSGTSYGSDLTFITPPQPILPTVATITPEALSPTTGTSGGNVTSDGYATVTARGVCWSTSSNPTTSNSKTIDGSGTGVFTSNLTGLSANTTYHVRAYATNSVGTGYGLDLTFTTPPQPVLPTVTTATPSATSTTTGSGGGNVTSDGNATVTARGVCWSTSSNPTTSNSKTTNGSGTGTFTSNLTGLSANTTYHVRAYATNSVGTGYGSDLTFTTPAVVLPTVTTTSPVATSTTTGTSGGNATSDGGGTITARGVCWSTSANPSTSNSKTTDGSGTGTFTSSITGLTANTTYHVRAYATNSAGTGYGSDLTFTTPPNPVAPTVITSSPSATSTTTASGGGNVTSDGNASVTARGICWSTSTNPTTSNSNTTDGSGTGTFTSSITGLTANTTYHVRAYATNSAGTGYGSDLTFTTPPNPVVPTVITSTPSATSTTTATTGGNVTSDGGATVTARGVCFSTSSNPTTSDPKTTNGSGTGTFTSSITGLTANTTYHVRAYATNSLGTAYGSDLTFTTPPNSVVPTVITSTPSATSTTTATAGGNVTSDGGATVTARGVCFSTSSNPTTSDPKTTNGSGTGTFTSSITGLTANTTYHVRAYATNALGTAYGSDMTFTTPTNPVVPTVTTSTPSPTTTTTATSGGNVTSDGGTAVTVRGVCWSTTANPTTANSTTTDGSGTGSYASSITGLTAGTSYHVRAYATNIIGTSYGADMTFSTPSDPVAPTVTTTAPSASSTTTGTSGGYVTSDGGAAVTARGICWSTASNPTTSNSKTNDGSGTGTFTSTITGLSPYTTYHVRAYATSSAGTGYGADMTFSTPAELLPPTVITRTPSATSATTGTGGGNVTSDGGLTVTVKGVCWSTTVNPTIANSKTNDGSGPGSYDSYITGLTANTTYHVRAFASNSLGTSYGSDMTFTTPANIVSPTVTTITPSAMSTTTATGGGNVTSDGGSSVTARGVCWSISSNPTTSNSRTTDGSGTGSFSSSITGLTAGTTYHVRAYATNSAGTAYGADLAFTTESATCNDAYEPNNSLSTYNTTAFSTAFGSSSSSSSISANISATNDWDVFRLNTTAAGTLTITINNPPADLAIELYDKNQTWLNLSNNQGSEQIVYSVTTTGYFYIVVGSSNGGYSCSNYTLAVNWVPANSCTDNYEPNNSLSAYNTTAFSTAFGSSSSNTSILSNISAVNDWDVFRLNTTAEGSLTITINNPPADLCIELYDKNQTWLKWSNNQGSEQLVYSVTTTGYYYIVVGSSNGGYSCSNYTLSVSWVPASTCTDSFEPNNSLSSYNTTAFSTSLGSTAYNHSISANINEIYDWDVFRFNVTGQGVINLSIINPPSDVALELYDMNQKILKWSHTSGNEYNSDTLTVAGYYYIVVGSSNSQYSCANYTLDLNWAPCSVLTNPIVSASKGTNCDGVVISWNAVQGSISYDVYRGTTMLGNTTALVYNDNAASSATTLYRVVARNACGFTAEGSDNGYKAVALSAPSVNATDGTSCEAVTVSWSAVAGATSYDVYRESTFLTNTGNTSFSDITAGTSSVQYRVFARNICGSSSAGTDNGHKSAGPVAPVVNASDGTNCEFVSVSWNAVSGANSYDIYRGTVFLLNTLSTSYNDIGSVFTSTQYKVIAKGSCGNSTEGTDYGHRASAPATPVLVASDGTSCESVSLSWNTVSGANSYDVYRGSTFVVNTPANSYQDMGATTAMTLYRIFAKNTCGSSSESSDYGYKATPPHINLGEDISVYQNSSIVLDAGAGYSIYQWSNNATTSAITLQLSNPGNYSYSVRVTDQNGCTDNDTIKITVNEITGLDENNLGIEYRLYPNPSSGEAFVYLKSDMIVTDFELYIHAMNGTLVKQQTIRVQQDPNYRLDFDPVPGIYNITIIYGDHMIKDRLVIR